MDFTSPISFEEALQELEGRDLLPTGLSSRELREEIPAALRRKAVFSAKMTNADAVQRLKDTVQRLLSPENRLPTQGINIATARAQLQDFYKEIGYDSEAGGFTGADDEKVRPAKRGSLKDLSSNARLQLTLETQVSQMANIGYRKQGDTPFARHTFPAWELVRGGPAREPRDWARRWHESGGDFYGGGRMIATKDSDVWERLGDSSLFDDALDQPFPPFAFGSHMMIREVDRDTCIRLGVIDASHTPKPSVNAAKEITRTADVNVGKFSDDFLAGLEGELGAKIKAGRLRLANRTAENIAVLLLARAIRAGSKPIIV